MSIKPVTTKNFDDFWKGFYHAVNNRIDCCALDFVEEEEFKHSKLMLDADAYQERLDIGDSHAFAQGYAHAVLKAAQTLAPVVEKEPELPCLRWANLDR